MTETTPLVQFPVPSTFTLVMLGFGFLALLAAAVGYEIFRRSQSVRAKRAAEWRSVRDILRERKISGESVGLIERMVKRHSPDHPLRAVTTREEFEHCVEVEMRSLQAKGDPKAFEQAGLRFRDIRSELGLDYVPLGQRMHSTRELHDGQWITMSEIDAVQSPRIQVMVEDVNEAYFYVVLKDRPTASAPRFAPDEHVRCRLWREEDARYVFDTTIAAYDEPPPTWRVHHTSDLRRAQAREHFRVRHDQPVTVGVLNAPVDGDQKDLDMRRVVTRLRGRITSLSAGGCAVVLKQPVSRQVLLRVNLELPGEEPLELESEIVSSSAISGGRYLLRVKFLGLEDETRDMIAKHVLHQQQQRLAAQQPSE